MWFRRSKSVKLLAMFFRRMGLDSVFANGLGRTAFSAIFTTSLVFTSVSPAKEYSDGEIKSTKQSVRQFQTLVRGTPYEASQEAYLVKLREFYAGQLSHVERVSQLTDMVLDNPEFSKQFSAEAEVLRNHRVANIKQALNHDGGKFLKETEYANEILTRSQGLNVYKLKDGIDDHLSPEKAKRLGTLLQESIDSVNIGEARVIDKGFRELSPHHRFTRANSLVVEINDFYDTGMSRQKEIGGKEKLKGAYDWILSLEEKGAFKDEPLGDIEFRKKYAKFIDQWDPLRKFPDQFAKPNDYLKIPTSNFIVDYKKAFQEKAKIKVFQASMKAPKTAKIVAQISQSTKKLEVVSSARTKGAITSTLSGSDGLKTGSLGKSKALAKKVIQHSGNVSRMSVVGGVLGATINYAISAEKADLTEGISKTGSCDSVACTRFMVECREQILLCKQQMSSIDEALECVKIVQDDRNGSHQNRFGSTIGKYEKDLPFHKIAEHEHFADLCIRPILNLSLEDQNVLRADHNLNRVISAYFPKIKNLTCQKGDLGTMKVEVEIMNPIDTKANYFQTLFFNSRKEIEKVERVYTEKYEEVRDNLFFVDSKAEILHHCSPLQKAYANRCRSFQVEEIKDLNLYHWRDDRLATPTGRLEGRVPIDSVKWARVNLQLAEYQSPQIQECCDDEACQKYFADQYMNYYQKVKGNRTAQVHEVNPATAGENQ